MEIKCCKVFGCITCYANELYECSDLDIATSGQTVFTGEDSNGATLDTQLIILMYT